MDFLALAQLPLATIVLAILSWALVQFFAYASGRYDDARKRAALHNRYILHFVYNLGSFRNGFCFVSEELKRIAELTATPSDKTDKAEGTQAAAQAVQVGPPSAPVFWELLFGTPEKPKPRPAQDIAARIANNNDLTITQGLLDTDSLAKALDQFDDQVAGLILFLVEELPMIETLVEVCNAKNDDKLTATEYVGSLVELQISFFAAWIAANALADKEFRKELATIVNSSPSHSLPVQRLQPLSARHLPGAETLYVCWKCDKDPGLEVVPLGSVAESEKGFDLSGLAVINHRFKKTRWTFYYALPIVFSLAAIVIVLFPGVRQFVFPPDPANCSAKYTPQGWTETTCSFSAPNVPQAIEEFRALAAPNATTDDP